MSVKIETYGSEKEEVIITGLPVAALASTVVATNTVLVDIAEVKAGASDSGIVEVVELCED